MQKNQEIIHELKCKACGKVCGTITFPHDTEVYLTALDSQHETYCDEHKVEKNQQ